jgi:hypothetical protein
MLANQRIAGRRGLPERKLQRDRWQSPSELIPRLMQRLGLPERVSRLRETGVIDAWSKIAGDFIAAHSPQLSTEKQKFRLTTACNRGILGQATTRNGLQIAV